MDSILLQKQVRDNAKDLQDFCKELKEWGDEIKKKDESLKRSPNNLSEVPLPKNKVSKVELSKERNHEKVITKQNKQIKGCDYAAWEKFDADAHCAKLDKNDLEEHSSSESELSDEIDESMIDMANSEKEKGNAFVKKQKWDQAIECYTRAIKYYAYDPIYYANRALCHLKQEKYQNAESDCTTALQLDKTYVKAYQRRAVARENLNQFLEAQGDLLRVLELEPKNKESRTVLIRVEKKLESTKQKKIEANELQRPVSKFTLSRQKHKNPGVKLQPQHQDTKKETPAISQHIIERIVPTNTSPISKVKSEAKSLHSNTKYSGREDNTENDFSVAKLPKNLMSKHNINDIEIFNSIYKPPKIRSKKPLKRIEIIDVDLETEKRNLLSKSEHTFKSKEDIPNEAVVEYETDTYKNIPIDTEKTEATIASGKSDSFDLLSLSSPKTAVQFYNNWKKLGSNNEWKKLYLQKINPSVLSLIFKESLESKVFSEIIEILNDSCNENEIPVYDYLLGLSNVKRFATIIMFMSIKDKKNLLNIVDYFKQNNKYAATDVDKLIKLYEL